MSEDNHYMMYALALARRGLGHVAPNPSVGCVIVKKNHVVGRARTADGGRPHAEAAALAMAGPQAKGATAYVTLEPCAVEGRGGPCAEALVKAGVKRVVIGCVDPNPAVNGAGIQILKNAGIEVTMASPILRASAEKMNKGFFLKVLESRPLVTLKLATDRHGNIPKSGWVTNESARRHAHFERTEHDAIMVGAGTVLADNPLLTSRLKGIVHRGIRVALDTHLKIPLDSKLVHSAGEYPLWVFYKDDPEGKKTVLEQKGVKLYTTGDLKSVLKKLTDEGITRLLVEGGPKIWASFIKEGFYDRLLWYKGAGDVEAGIPAFPTGVTPATLRLTPAGSRAFGQDLLEIYEK